MPNWCNNSISIVGPKDTIKQLWEDAKAQEDGFGLLNAIHPMPKELEGTTSPSETGNDWYSWRVSNWGTKWDISDEGLEYNEVDEDTAEITGWFDSAWAPPIGAYEQFADSFDNCSLEASYHEPGMDFAGFWSVEGGDEYCEDLHSEYNKPEEMRSDLFNRLDEEYDLSNQFAEWEEMDG
jgi:hypothetical protein